MTKRGHCLCGKTRWAYQGEVTWACYCHCDDCRRNCAAPVVAWLGVPIKNFRWLGEAPKTRESSKGVRRHFCESCGSPMGFEADHYPGGMHLYAASLEDPSDFNPTFHVNDESKLPWLQINDDLPKYQGTLLQAPEDLRNGGMSHLGIDGDMTEMSGSDNTEIIAEICVDSIEGVRAAMAANAARVELCSALLEGGLTPSFGITKQAKAVAGPVAVHVMIRPRGGDFLYSDDEVAAMKDDIMALGGLGVDGFVFGLLTSDGKVDVERTAELTNLCRPATVTFHRAFDMARDPFASLDALIDLGVDRLLTSGQAPGVLEGAPLIRDLIDRAAGRMVIMPGGDISARNVARIVQETGADEIHFAAFEPQQSPMRHRNPHVFMGGTLRPPEYDRTVTTKDGISNVLRAIKTPA